MNYGWLFATAVCVLCSVVLFISTIGASARAFLYTDRRGMIVGTIGTVVTAGMVTLTVWVGSHLG